MGYAVVQFDIAGPCNTNIRRALDPDVVVLWVRMDARRVVSWVAAAAVLGDDISCAETESSYLIISGETLRRSRIFDGDPTPSAVAAA